MLESQEEFSQLYLRFTDPIQYDYEAIRPVIFFVQPIAQWTRELVMFW